MGMRSGVTLGLCLLNLAACAGTQPEHRPSTGAYPSRPPDGKEASRGEAPSQEVALTVETERSVETKTASVAPTPISNLRCGDPMTGCSTRGSPEENVLPWCDTGVWLDVREGTATAGYRTMGNVAAARWFALRLDGPIIPDVWVGVSVIGQYEQMGEAPIDPDTEESDFQTSRIKVSDGKVELEGVAEADCQRPHIEQADASALASDNSPMTEDGRVAAAGTPAGSVPSSKEAVIVRLLQALADGDESYLRQAVRFPFDVAMSTSSDETVRASSPGQLIRAWKRAEGTPETSGSGCWNGLEVQRVTESSFTGDGYYTCRGPAWNRWIDFELVDGRWVAIEAGLGGR